MVDIEKVILYKQRLRSRLTLLIIINTTITRHICFEEHKTVFVIFIIVQAIAHYEQAADYYKGEESNRYCFFIVFFTRLKYC